MSFFALIIVRFGVFVAVPLISKSRDEILSATSPIHTITSWFLKISYEDTYFRALIYLVSPYIIFKIINLEGLPNWIATLCIFLWVLRFLMHQLRQLIATMAQAQNMSAAMPPQNSPSPKSVFATKCVLLAFRNLIFMLVILYEFRIIVRSWEMYINSKLTSGIWTRYRALFKLNINICVNQNLHTSKSECAGLL